MESSQSRLLDTQYILEYEPSPVLVGEFSLYLCTLSWVVPDSDLCWCNTGKDALCKPLQTQDGCCKSTIGQDGLSKPTVWALAAEIAVSQPSCVPRQQMQAHDITHALQLNVEGALHSSLSPGGFPPMYRSCFSACPKAKSCRFWVTCFCT